MKSTAPKAFNLGEDHAARVLAKRLEHSDFQSPEAELMTDDNTVFANSPSEIASYGEVKFLPPRARFGFDLQRTALLATTGFMAIAFIAMLQPGDWMKPNLSAPNSPTSAPVTRTAPTGEAQPTQGQATEAQSENSGAAADDAATSGASGYSSAASANSQSTNQSGAPSNESNTNSSGTAPQNSSAQSSAANASAASSAASSSNDSASPVTENSAANSAESASQSAPVPTAATDSNATAAGENSSSASDSNSNVATDGNAAPSASTPRAYVRSSASTNSRLGGNGQPVNGSGDGARFTSLRPASSNSDFEIERLSRAIDAGGSGGRDLGVLFQQRALLYLNQGDKERAVPDFEKAIAAYQAMIARGERVGEARDGLVASQSGLKIARASAQVYRVH